MGTREEQSYSVKLSPLQRRTAARAMPELSDRLLLDEAAARPITLSRSEIDQLRRKVQSALGKHAGMERYALRVISGCLSAAIEAGRGIGAIPPKVRVYQFRIALKHTRPAIWRRIQTRNCTLDRLHEIIQLSMGWTNSHLHEFTIAGVRYGDPMLLGEDSEVAFEDSTRTYLVDFIPQSGARFQFDYLYDFGDSWEHAVEFEGCLAAEEGAKYPRCIDGQRACPPEDVGGTYGFAEYRRIMSNPRSRQYQENAAWSGPFDPEEFDLEATNRRIKRGLPDWRKTD